MCSEAGASEQVARSRTNVTFDYETRFSRRSLVETEKELASYGSTSLQSNPVSFAAIVRESGQCRRADFRRWLLNINLRCWV